MMGIKSISFTERSRHERVQLLAAPEIGLSDMRLSAIGRHEKEYGMKAKKPNVDARRVVLAVVILGVLLMAGTAIHAGPLETATRPSVRPPTVFDPFKLTTVTVSSVPTDDKPSNPAGPANVSRRSRIRVSSRPPCRSTFRPAVDWRYTGP